MKPGWRQVPLGSVCKLLNGRAYNKEELLYEGPTPVLRVGNFFTNPKWYYSDLELEPNKYCDDGDLLYAWSASFGPRLWQGGRVIYHYHIWKMEPDSTQLDKRFLYYFLDWDKERIKASQGAGTTMIHVTKGSMEARPLWLPPLEEQRRIAAVLDQIFSAIDIANDKAERNLANARALFPAIFAHTLVNPGQGWSVADIGEIADLISGQHIDASDYNNKRLGIGYLTGPSDFGERVPIVTKWTEHPKRTAIRGDILITVKGSGVGSVNVMDEDELAISRQLMAVRVTGTDPELVYYAFEAGFVHFQGLATGAAIPGLSRNDVLSFRIAIPPEAETERFMKRLHDLRAKALALESNYRRQITQLGHLKQSLLERAFLGGLSLADSEPLAA